MRLSAYQELGKFIASFTHNKPEMEPEVEENEEGNENVKPEVGKEETGSVQFTQANYWREDLPQLDFDSLSLSDEEEPEVTHEPMEIEPEVEPEVNLTQQSETEVATEVETENAAGDSPSKDIEESSTPDAGLYEALVSITHHCYDSSLLWVIMSNSIWLIIQELNIKDNEIYIGDDDEVPVDYSKEGMTHHCS